MNREIYEGEDSHASVLRTLLVGKRFLYILVFQFLTFVFATYELIRSTDRLSSLIRFVKEAASFLHIDISSLLESLENIAFRLDALFFVWNLTQLILLTVLVFGCFLMRFGANNECRQWMIRGIRLCECYCVLNIVVHLLTILVLAVLVNIVTVSSLWVLVVVAVILIVGISIFRYIYFGKLSSFLKCARGRLAGTSNTVVYSPYVILWGRVWFFVQIIGAFRKFLTNTGSITSQIRVFTSIPKLIATVCTATCVLLVSELLSAYRKRTR